jgi:hypothetical protein
MKKNKAPKGKGRVSRKKAPKKQPRRTYRRPHASEPLTSKQAELLTREEEPALLNENVLPLNSGTPNSNLTTTQEQKNAALPVVAARKKVFIEAMVKHLGIATRASIVTGIPARTHRHWLATDEVYRDAIQDIKEVCLDFYEEMLHDLVRKKNPAAVIFALKTQGKKRGYIETVHNFNQNFDDNNVHYYLPDNGRDGLLEDAQIVSE